MAGFKINQREEQDRWVESEERLWLDADRSKLVTEDDPAAAHLFATPSTRISMEDAEKYGLVKAQTRAADKQAAPSADKARKPSGKKG